MCLAGRLWRLSIYLILPARPLGKKPPCSTFDTMPVRQCLETRLATVRKSQPEDEKSEQSLQNLHRECSPRGRGGGGGGEGDVEACQCHMSLQPEGHPAHQNQVPAVYMPDRCTYSCLRMSQMAGATGKIEETRSEEP